MTTLPRKRRRMFFRLVIMFGALVAIPLSVSGVLLSYIGRGSVLQVGDDMTATSAETMRDSSQRLIQFATKRFTDSASNLISLSGEELKKSHQEQIQVSAEALEHSSRGLMQRGDETLRKAIDQMTRDSHTILTKSNESLRKKQEEAVDNLSGELTAKVGEVFRNTAKQLNERNRQKMEELVMELNADRAQFLMERASAYVREIYNALSVVAQRARFFPAERVLSVLPRGKDGARPPRPPVAAPGEEMPNEPPRPSILSPVNDLALVDPGDRVFMPKHTYCDPDDFLDGQQNPLHREALNAVRGGAVSYVSPVVFEGGAGNPTMTVAFGGGKGRSPEAVLIADVDLEVLSRVVTPAARMKGKGAAEAAVFIVQSNGAKRQMIAHSDRSRVGSEVEEIYKEVVDRAFRDERDTGTRIVGQNDEEQRVVTWYRFPVVTDQRSWVLVSTQPISDVTLFSEKMRQAIDDAVAAAAQQTETEMRRIAADTTRQFAAEQGRLAQRTEDTIRRVSTSTLNARLKTLEAHEREVMQKASDAIHAHGLDMQQTLEQLEENLLQATAREAQEMSDEAAQQVHRGVREIQQRTPAMANKSARRILKNSLLLIALFLIVAVGLAAATAKSVVTPVEQLLDGTTALAAGDYAKRVPVKSDDEIGLLASGFNDMAAAVERSRAELERTNQRLAEEKERIHYIIEGIPDGVMMVDHEGQVVFLNSAVGGMLNLSASQNDSEQLSLRDGVLQPVAERADAALNEPQTILLEHPRQRVLRLRAVRMRDEAGQPGRLLLLHDVTREHEIDEMKNAFIALVSHELRTPLTSILAFSSYLLTEKLGPLTDGQKTGVESMYRQAKRLSAIISDFLDVSRIESGKVQMQKQPIAVDQVAQRVVEELKPQAEEKQIAVTMDKRGLPKDAPVIALADEQRLAQVLTNLLGNALKFTDANGKVNVSLSAQNGGVLVSVTDTGCGIPAEELPKIFDRFYQVERVVTRKTGGTGLGLAIVKNIVEAHGGRVWVQSRVGEGTTVHFTLPR